MFKDKNSSAIVAVTDLDRARHFYESILGLPLLSSARGVLSFKTGATTLIVYKSDFAGTNQANAAAWGVGEEVEAITADLKVKGVTFEHYPGMELQGDIHVGGDFKAVWFKDPDGNILHYNNM